MACDSEMSSEQVDQPAPILNLPPELFLNIASILVREWPPHTPRWMVDIIDEDFRHVPLSPGTLGWMNVSYVCRQWRELCISAQSLWTYWIGRLPQAIPVIASRAGNNTSFHVDVDFTEICDYTHTSDRYSRLWHVLPPMSRIRTISWKTPTCEEADSVGQRLCSTSAANDLSCLESLSIQVVDKFRGLGRQQEGSLHAPVLRALCLDQTLVASIDGPLLTVLNLRRPTNLLDHKTLYNLLVGCPMLTSLSIIESHFWPYCTELTPNTLSLDHLDYLRLDRPMSVVMPDAEYGDVFMLLTYVLRIPATATIEVAIVSPVLHPSLSAENSATASLAFCLEPIMQADSPNTLCLDTHTVALATGASAISAPYTAWRTHTLPNARTRARIDHAFDSTIFISCFVSADSDRLTQCLRSLAVLSLDPPWPCDDEYRDATRKLLQALPSLRTIRITSNSTWDELLEPLGSLNPDTDGVLLPELESLWLDGACPSENDIGGYDSALDDVQLQALTSTLVARARLLSAAGMGRSPRTIFLHNFSTVPPDDSCVQLLRSEVADVVFVPSEIV
ncbi:hypothetical protein PENSPDRAFT_656207 [Peniophora sp. CONT]|nr:hypothetical protein PENSPDRAFT_656207 [Peniophora sp. CONT]